MASQDRHDYSSTFGYVWDVATLRWVKGKQALLEAGSVTITLPNEGQQTMANSISVAVASDQSAIPVTVTSATVSISQTGTANDVDISGVTPVSGRLPVDGSGVTQPVSGTVTSNQGGSWTEEA